ncbi:MAG TPA: PHB depolymerase family esterase [Steroidobacteraceae bacterium]|nr:PHB depolymerase family esterase [Steroidobacteraceae bacterium]
MISMIWMTVLALAAARSVAQAAPVELERLVFETSHGQRAALVHPQDRPSALVLLLHGAGSDAEQMRALTGYGFERLAEQAGWVVVYAEGFGKTWNDCRRTPLFPAKTHNIDDVSFLAEVIHTVRTRYGIPKGRVLVGGFSNGGQMAMRLALERPNAVDGFLAIGAQMPLVSESLCAMGSRPVHALFVAGTADPIAPYMGGASKMLDGRPLGSSESARATAAAFAQLAGYKGAGMVSSLGDRDGDGRTTVEFEIWRSAQLPSIQLYTIHGGGHTIPQKEVRFPPAYGATSADVDIATVTLEFMRTWSQPATAGWQLRTAERRERTLDCRQQQAGMRLSACLRPLYPMKESQQLVAHF